MDSLLAMPGVEKFGDTEMFFVNQNGLNALSDVHYTALSLF